MSSTLADQLQLKQDMLATPLALQLVVQGSQSKVNATTSARLSYQGINKTCTFDIINVNSYDLILGTPWMYQHQLCLGFNLLRVVIGCDESQQLKDGPDTKLMVNSLSLEEQSIKAICMIPQRYTQLLCKEIDETKLPPFWAINHTIPLIDETKTYPWQPSKCPKAFRAQWIEKWNA